MNNDKAYLMSMIEATKDLLKLAEEIGDSFGKHQLPIILKQLEKELEEFEQYE